MRYPRDKESIIAHIYASTKKACIRASGWWMECSTMAPISRYVHSRTMPDTEVKKRHKSELQKMLAIAESTEAKAKETNPEKQHAMQKRAARAGRAEWANPQLLHPMQQRALAGFFSHWPWKGQERVVIN